MADLRGPEIEDFCILKPISRGAFGYDFYEAFSAETTAFEMTWRTLSI